MKRFRLVAVAGVAAAIALSSVVWAAGMWSVLPVIGGASYCASTVSGAGGFNAAGNTNNVNPTGQGQATSGSLCAQTVPAGPPTFAGTEVAPFDIYAPGTSTAISPTTALVNITQLGQGPMVDQTTVGTTQTIPNQTPFFFLDGAQASALTVTMPSTPVEGQIQRIFCTAATVGVLTVAANSGQSVKNNPNAACTAGVGYGWRYQASNTTWYRFQ